MFRTIVDQLYGVNSAMNWFRGKYPEEEVLFASAATVLETRDTNPIGWSFKRFLQRRGIVVITGNRVFLRSSFFSPFTVLYLVAIIGSVALWLRSQDFMYLIFGILALPFVLQRLPYRREIHLQEIEEVKLGSVRGITMEASLLTVLVTGKAINIVPAQVIPREVVEMLAKETA